MLWHITLVCQASKLAFSVSKVIFNGFEGSLAAPWRCGLDTCHGMSQDGSGPASASKDRCIIIATISIKREICQLMQDPTCSSFVEGSDYPA